MKNVPILGKFLLVMAVFGLFAVGAAVFSANRMQAIDQGYRQVADQHGVAALYFSRALSRLHRARAGIAGLLIASEPEDKAALLTDLRQHQEEFLKLMDRSAAALPAKAKEVLELKGRAAAQIATACDLAIKTATDPLFPQATAQAIYLKDCAPGFLPLTADLTKMILGFQAESEAMRATLRLQTEHMVMVSVGIVLGGLFAVMLGGFLAIRRWVAAPLVALAGTMSRLSEGDLSTPVSGTERPDEIGAMSRAVQVFKEAGLEKMRLERQAEAERAAAEEGRRTAERERQAMADQQAFVVQSLADGLERLSKGDLTCTLPQPFAPEYERLRTDFNAAVAELRGVMGTVVATAGTLRSGSGEIGQAADDLSRRTEQQAASLEETAAALDEITTTVRRTAEAAAAVRNVATAASTEAESGEAVVRNAVAAMTAIETSAQEISQIIGVIDEIAFQTNLLALNAGVEAARAGDAGRGFAVVASEVRALAQRSAEAAKEIKGLIGNSSAQVGRGVVLVRDAGTTLGKILGQVREINGSVGAIAASAQEQATGLAEVNTAVNQMDQVTQQNAAMVEQSTAASHKLAQDTAELERLTARFRTEPGSPATRRDAPALPQPPRPAAAPPRAQRSLRVVGNTVARADAEVDAWQEF